MIVCFSAVMEVAWKLRPPTKKVTPYGAQLVWTLPGGNLLIVHLKDKNKIRHKKRWSQVSYATPEAFSLITPTQKLLLGWCWRRSF